MEFSLWRRIYLRVGPYWKVVVLATLMVSLAAATQPTLAIIMKPLLDEGFSGAKPQYVWMIPLAVIGLTLVRGFSNFASDYLLSWVANNMLLGIRKDMFSRLLELPDEAFKRGDTGRLLNRFTVDAGVVTSMATEVITVIVKEVLIVVALLGVLLYMSWQLTLIVIVMLPVSTFIARLFIKRLRRINRDTITMNAELTRVVREGIDGQRVIKLFDGKARESERFDYVNARLRRFAMRAASADAAMTPLTQVAIAIAVASVIAVALYQANADTLTVGGFAAFMAALAQIFDPVKRLTNVASKMQRMLVSAESVFTLIDEVGETDQGKHALPSPVRGKVEFRDIRHRFPGAAADTLADVSFTIEPGQTVALVGRSGSGKTTLANMLPRFVTPTEGGVYVDGNLITDCTLSSLRAQLSLVSQDVVMFEGTIADNVGYGALHEASEQEINAAIDAAHLREFVDSHPHGLQAKVGENANVLSGGQRQRLAIARALIKNAPILILDEATSALDSESESQVQASLDRLMAGRTTLVIAHRLSTVQKADKILVLDAGRIIEQGSHDELLAKGGLYAALYQMQFQQMPGDTANESAQPTLRPENEEE
ncbi:lipid A export permease/ATP-binding protein MsbA [Pusillimonas sp. CC-YST705]|uniref:Lipid A export permease/ATP-binding protein MsbA n=1 Tax=Mesopusillimonas faecipullorum TaxID=2755040 RepID=A0ABS8CG79_9BURK|nr:lipid A export permease/ATP-binding protein MsbA [Mesopusillimonas faecipullorum]